jgi:hypothetical protein
MASRDAMVSRGCTQAPHGVYPGSAVFLRQHLMEYRTISLVCFKSLNAACCKISAGVEWGIPGCAALHVCTIGGTVFLLPVMCHGADGVVACSQTSPNLGMVECLELRDARNHANAF